MCHPAPAPRHTYSVFQKDRFGCLNLFKKTYRADTTGVCIESSTPYKGWSFWAVTYMTRPLVRLFVKVIGKSR